MIKEEKDKMVACKECMGTGLAPHARLRAMKDELEELQGLRTHTYRELDDRRAAIARLELEIARASEASASEVSDATA